MATLRNPYAGYEDDYNQMPETDPSGGMPQQPAQPEAQAPEPAPLPQAPIVTGAPAPQQAGGWDLERFRKEWTAPGIGSKVGAGELQKFIADHPEFTQGATLSKSGDALFKDGKFVADLIADVGGKNTRGFLDHIGSNGKARPPKAPKAPKGGINPPGPGNLPKAPAGPAAGPAPGPTAAPGLTPAPSLTPDVESNQAKIMETLKALMGDGGFNSGAVTARISAADDALNRGRKSRLATNRAALAERGLLGSGAETSSQNRMEGDLYDSYAGAVRDIHTNESEQADARKMQAIQTATGMTAEQARNIVDQFNATTGRIGTEGNLALGKGRLGLDTELGRGNLALGNKRLSLDELLGKGQLSLGNRNAGIQERLGQGNLDLGWGNLNLNRDQYLSGESNQDYDRMIELLKLYGNAANTTGR